MEKLAWIAYDELEKSRLNFSRSAFRDTPLNNFLLVIRFEKNYLKLF